jgi:PRTRC genetic system protein B
VENGEKGLRWALPESLEVPPDRLTFRVDIYGESILLHHFESQETTTRLVSAQDIARAFTRELRLHSGILPREALWWALGPEGEEVALWQRPRVWRLALQLEAFQPPRRFTLPLPGLVFVCSPGRPPRVYAARARPTSLGAFLYHAPLFNVFRDGRSCPGTHRYPERLEEIPESFFQSFFSPTADPRGRSKRYPDDLLQLWEELEGKKSYPVRDLVPFGRVEDIMK